MDWPKLAVLAAAGLHLLFVVGEMFPWNCPLILKKVMAQRGVSLAGNELKLTATIVHNAGIYNVIMVAGFLWSAYPDVFGPWLEPPGLKAVRVFFLCGAVIAGLVGLTLSRATLLQAAIGVIGLAIVCFV